MVNGEQMIMLDLFCGQGGASEGYRRAGFEMFGVDIVDQPLYPFWFHQGDAIKVAEALVAGYGVKFTHSELGERVLFASDLAAAHGSPPCQSFSAYRRRGAGVGDGYLNLIPETRELLAALNVPYVIENVPGSPLNDPIQLCGSSFKLDVRRHRLFESNVEIESKPCDHSWQTPRFPPATNRKNLRRTVEVGVWRIPLDVQKKAMGIDWMTLPGLTESIPPAYSEHIGEQLARVVAGGSF